MSLRRKASAKVSPLKSPHSAKGQPATKIKASKSIRRSSSGDANLHLKVPAPASLRSSAQRSAAPRLSTPIPVVDAQLEELLQMGNQFIGPIGAPSSEEKEQAAAERVEEAKEALGKLECEVVSALFPKTGIPQSLEEVAERLGMTVKEVRDVADNALRGLRGTKSSRPRPSTVWN